MFEWDEKKNRTNQEKHGTSFKQAMKKKKSTKKISSKELDRKFEKNEESILQFFDTENPIKRV